MSFFFRSFAFLFFSVVNNVNTMMVQAAWDPLLLKLIFSWYGTFWGMWNDSEKPSRSLAMRTPASYFFPSFLFHGILGWNVLHFKTVSERSPFYLFFSRVHMFSFHNAIQLTLPEIFTTSSVSNNVILVH